MAALPADNELARTGFIPLDHAQLLLNLGEGIRDNGGCHTSPGLLDGLRCFRRLRDPLAPPRALQHASNSERESSLKRERKHQIAEHLYLAFGRGSGSDGGEDGGRVPCREAFFEYAKIALESDSRPRLLLHTRPHFFPPHLVADSPYSRRKLSDRVDFAMRLWLFDRQCALEAVERLLVHRVQLAAHSGMEAAARNDLVVWTNLYLVRGRAPTPPSPPPVPLSLPSLRSSTNQPPLHTHTLALPCSPPHSPAAPAR
jgi:hypothetical protein